VFGRLLVAIVMGIVAMILLMIIAGLVVGGGSSGGSFAWIVGLIGLVLFIFLWVRNASSVRQTFRRSLLTVAVECFAMPLVGLIFTAVYTGSKTTGGADTAGALLGGVAVTGTLTCVGFALGIFCLVLYLALRAEPQSRPAPQA
jgi:hypothetical protein